MTTQSNHSLIPSKFFSQLCGLIAAGLGVVAIAGWLTGWRILSGIRADYIPMAPNTALSFIVLGVSLYALITERKPALKLSGFGAAVIFVLSLIRFAEFSVNINLNVDRWIFQAPSEKLGLIPVGRMALPTALNFLFASVALFLASSLKRRWSVDALTRVLAGLTTFIGLAFCLGYIYGAPLLYGGTTIPMALNTAISFFVLGLGLVINNLSHDIAERKRAAEALRKAHDELEVRVAERTAELAKANEALRAEIIERKQKETELRKVNRDLKVLSECNQAMLHASDEQNLLNEICRIVVETGGYRLAWVGFAEDDESKTVRPVAQSGYEEGYLANLKITWADTETGRGPTGTAIRTGNPSIAQNIQTDPNFAPWRAEAVKRGYASSIALPLIAEGKTLGALNIYEVEVDAFNMDEVNLLKELAADLAYGITSIKMRSDRMKAVEALRESEKRYRSLVESVTDYIYTVHVENGKAVDTYHGPGCVAVTGYTTEEYRADPYLWYRMVYEEDREAVIEQANRVLSGEFVQPLEHRIVHKAGEIRWVRNAPVPRHDEQGRVVAYDGLITDITGQKKLEEQLRQAQKMEAIGQLAGGVAHDFNNILTAIIGYSNLLIRKRQDDSIVKEYAGEIISSSNRTAALIRDLLTFSRKHTINPQPADLNELIKMVEKILARIIGEHIELKVNPADKNLIVKMDADQIEQVLLNLAVNARDAMPEGGKLTIDVSHVELGSGFIDAHNYGMPGQYALITFTDTGAGMNKDIQSRIFEPFFTTKEVGKGTGLGLSMVYGAIKQHNGYITVYSEPGYGTIFKIYLPLSEEGVLGEKKKPEIAAPKGNMETILVAEDDPDTRRTIKAVLEEYNYKVIEAVDGSDAISKFMERKGEIRLLILDTIMPRVNGKQAYEGIKKIDPNIKAIFISGYTADMIKAKDLLETEIELLAKPIAPDKLLSKIRKMIDEGDLTK